MTAATYKLLFKHMSFLLDDSGSSYWTVGEPTGDDVRLLSWSAKHSQPVSDYDKCIKDNHAFIQNTRHSVFQISDPYNKVTNEAVINRF